ncbi:WD40/YVTN/BNR-like repeat-containing protein [Rohdeia mirabilis]
MASRSTALSLALAPILVVTGFGVARAQEPELQAPLPSPKNMLSISAVSSDEVWATAGALFAQTGDLVHSTDGGATWEVLPVNTTSTLNSVFFLDQQRGWCAGNGIFFTTDGGATWTKANDWGSIYTLHFVDELHGWAGGNGGYVYRTTDGGQTWAFGVSVQSGWTVRDLWFRDALEGYAISIDGTFSRTTDGGASWSVVMDLTPSFLDPLPNTTAIEFVGANEVWVIGGETFMHSIDGGATWSQAAVPVDTWAHAAAFADALHGVAVGDSGNLVRTEDGGLTWTTVDTPYGQRLWDVSFSGGVGYVCGANGLLLRSDDFGATWSQISSGAAHTARDVDALDAHRAWVAYENGEIALTTNGGQLWERIQVDGFDEYGDLWCIDFFDANNGWAAGMQQVFGLADDGQIARSVDGGRTWTLQFAVTNFEFFGLEALDEDTAIAFGRGNFASSAFVRTEDGGATWFPSGPVGTTNGFRGADFLPDKQTGWLVGNSIYRTDDGGLTWTKQFDSPVMLASVSFADARNGWASGFQNTLFRTTDGGITWTPQTAGGPAGAAYMGVEALSPDEAYLVGWNRFVAHTTDGGSSWSPVPLPPVAHNLYTASAVEWNAVDFVEGGNGWFVGNEGTYAIRDERTFVATPHAISVATGGQQTFTLRPGPEHENELFVLMGTFSGTSPGFVDPNSGLLVPIVYDGYTNLLLGSWGASIVTPLFGLVGPGGFSQSRFSIPAGTDPSFAGQTLHHAFFTIDLFGSGLMEHASNAESLELLP